MNYRHAFHAGNFADILKHVVLAQCVSYMTAKDKPFRIIDTHAGIGTYDLASNEAERSPEWKEGVARLWEADLPDNVAEVLEPYLSVIKGLNEGALKTYPGSPQISADLSRDFDRLHLCELHEEDSRTLGRYFSRDARVKVENRDGYHALTSLLPPKEKRGLVIIDPPFEHPDELAHMAQAAMAAITKWPTGTFIFWRSLKNMWAVDRFDQGLSEWLISEKGIAPEKILRADLWVRDLASEGKLPGAGVVIVNPPWELEDKLLGVMPWLADTLAQGDGYGWRVDGGLTEEDVEAADAVED